MGRTRHGFIPMREAPSLDAPGWGRVRSTESGSKRRRGRETTRHGVPLPVSTGRSHRESGHRTTSHGGSPWTRGDGVLASPTLAEAIVAPENVGPALGAEVCPRTEDPSVAREAHLRQHVP